MKYNHQIYLIFILLFNTFDFSISSVLSKPLPLEYKGAVLAHIHDIRHGYGSENSKNMHTHLKNVGFNTVQLNTFCYMKDIKIPDVLYGFDPSLQPQYLEKEIQNLHSIGFKVMLKPHLWIGGATFDPDNWRNKIDYKEEKMVNTWFKSYSKFILYQAEIAERTGVEIFVIGTELVGMSKYEKNWKKLIKEIRSVYSGKLTYAAEGLNAKKITFWLDLDYIGIDAYFRLTDKNNPELWEIEKGWEKYKPELYELYKKYNKKIIFTEIGYKSVEGTTIKPWEWEKDKKTDFVQQAKAFEAFFRTFSNVDYIEGFFIWKYFTNNDSYERGNVKNGFTPYNKIAEGVISSWIK